VATREYTPRERIVFSAAQLIRREGVGATGMRDVVEHAGAPRGSLQHYFPGGKEQLVNEAVVWAGTYAANRIPRFLASLRNATPSRLFAAMADQWIAEFVAEGFDQGCPIAAVTVDGPGLAESTRGAAASAFGTWLDAVTTALHDLGIPKAKASSLATLVVSSLEGALLLARAERDVRPMRTVVRELGPLLDAAVR
jgi:AcrR family transcriptional regulator